MVTSALADGPRQRPERPTILVVEDEVLLRLTIAEELRSEGFPVIEAANADEALTVLQTSAPVELMMTDIRMPGSMDGLALAGYVRATRPELKIIVTSGHSPATPSRDIIDAFFVKPYDFAGVVRRVKELLTRICK